METSTSFTQVPSQIIGIYMLGYSQVASLLDEFFFFCTKIKETNSRCVIGLLKDLGPTLFLSLLSDKEIHSQ